MQLNYNSTPIDQNHLGRVFLFFKRNYWLYIIDLFIILFLVIPPYNWEETRLLLILLIVLLFRDVIVLKLSYKHLGKFVAKGNEVLVGILNGSKLQEDRVEWLPDMELEVKYKMGIPVLYVLNGNEIVFKQYPVGNWTLDKMKEFIDSFYDYKKEQALWKIYKGQD